MWLQVLPMPVSVGRYALGERVGQGGMADVYRARLCGIGGFEREVAVKLLRPPFAADSEFVDMLLDEARIAGSIVHSNVVQVLDVGREEDCFYLVMEFVDGTDLRRLLKRARSGRLPLEHALFIAMEIAQGLSAVHASSRRVVHRDVSPTNVLLSRAGEVKLADFGIARAQSRLARTRAGSIKGKLRYMAPEQQSGRPVDARADLYALGILLAETLVGPTLWEHPEEAPSAGTMLTRATKAGLPADVMALLTRALRANPEQRFADAASMRRALAEPLHARQPGYGEINLAAYLADPTVPAAVELAPELAAVALAPGTPAAAALQATPDAAPQSSPLALDDTVTNPRSAWVVTPRVPNQAAPPSPPDPPHGASEPPPPGAHDEPPTRNLRVSLARRALAGLRALTGRGRVLMIFGAAAVAGVSSALLATHATKPAAAARRELAAEASPVTYTGRPTRTSAVGATRLKTAPAPGRLAVYAPPWVRVRAGGKVRHAPVLFTLPPGRHRVELITRRGRRIVRQVDILSDRTAELSVL